ncbi:MAG: protein kinase [Candidatus Eisenbacteria bacterium]|nr:protein kinase [Candidatus Eisenbacteria bacterium]
MVGTSIGHYQILERLGAGGMGVVYRARDQKLQRDVALKLLPDDLAAHAERIARLTTEARAVAGLNHPNIVTLHSIEEQGGRHFLTMELVVGHTLDRSVVAGGMPIDRLLAIARPLAEALAAAHRVGVLHRDLKPSNVMLTEDGRTKVLDFGLAKQMGDTAGSHESNAETAAYLTREGVAVGTLPYMPPEQLQGRATDARSDLYSYGALLFELATGRRPLTGASDADLVTAILRDAPPPVSRLRAGVPAALERLIARCLEKDPAARFASAADIVTELAAIATGATSAVPDGPAVIRALAVLPLENLTRDPSQDYFTDGMTEALIFDLSRIKALRVISRTSAMKYKGALKALPEIAAELNVDAILEGAAMLSGKRVRVNVKLVAARTEETLWAERYDGDLEDVLGLQTSVAEAVAREIAVQVTPVEAQQLAQRRIVNPEAHVELLKGRYHEAVGSTPSLELSLKHFRQAIAIDDAYAAAWAGLADLHLSRASRGMVAPADATAAAEAAAQRALQLDPTSGEALAALGWVYSWRGDLAGGLGAVQRALELTPGQPSAHRRLGAMYYSLERHSEALREMTTALSLDPLSMLLHTSLGDAHYYARRYEESVPYYRKAIEIDSRFDGAHTDLARSLEALGRFDEARAEYEEGRRLAGGVAGPSFGLAHLEISMGNVDEGRRQLQQLVADRAHRVVSAWGIATVHARLNEPDETFRWLDIAFAERATGLTLLRVHPRLDAIRHDPRYAALVKRVGLDVT